MPIDMFVDPEGWQNEFADKLRRELRGTNNAPREYSDRDLQGMVAETDAEIFREAMGADEPDDSGNRDLEMMDSIDGSALSDDEQLEAIINGNRDPDYLGDRPIDFERETSALQTADRLQRELDEKNRYIQASIDAPRFEEQRQRDGEQLLDATLQDPAKAADLYRAMAARNAQLEQARVDASLAEAHRRYGRDFEHTYSALSAMDGNNPLSHAIMNNIRNSADPGEATMEMHGNDLVASLGTGRPTWRPPFMAGVSRESDRANWHQPVGLARTHTDEQYETNSGYGNDAVEDDVFADAVSGLGRRGGNER